MPRSKGAGLVLLAALAGCSLPAPAEMTAAPPPARFVDLTDDYARLYDASEGRAPEERARFVREGMAASLPDFYTPEFRGVEQARIDRFFAKYLAESYPAEREAIAGVATRFGEMMAPGLADFEARVGPLPPDVPVYLIVSMGEFDGATRELGGRTFLLFGADMIASLHKGNDPKPLVQHELFHIYHQQHFSNCGAMWCSLWVEGLATYAAQELNPGASDSELLLTVPEPIRPQVEANRDEAVCAVVERLDSQDDEARSALFSFKRMSANLPPRFGYLVGSWVAADLGRGRSIAQLASLEGNPLRSEIEKSLRSMADCP